MRKTDIYKFSFIIIAVITAAGISACTPKEVTKTTAEGDKTFSFYNSTDGGKYEVTFDKTNSIKSLVKNSKEIPESEYENYEETVFRNLNEITGNRHVYHFDRPDWDFEIESGGVDTPEFERRIIIRRGDDSTSEEDVIRLRSEFPGIHNDFFVEKWNDSTFKKDMKRMKEDLAKLKDIKVKVNFDSDKFHKEMEIFRKELNENLNEDLKELNEEILDATRELREKRLDEILEIKVDIPDIEVELKNLDRKMVNLDKEMSKVKTEMKKLEGFMKDIREELYKDKIIESKDEDFSLHFSNESIKVNSEEIPSGLLPKYKQLYKKHFGKEIGKKERFEIKN